MSAVFISAKQFGVRHSGPDPMNHLTRRLSNGIVSSQESSGDSEASRDWQKGDDDAQAACEEVDR
jgi:hypothetical protein